MRHRAARRVLQHRDQPAKFDAVGMRLDFAAARVEVVRSIARRWSRGSFGIDVVDSDVRIGDGGLFEIVVDAAAAAHITSFQLDRHAGSAAHFLVMRGMFIGCGVVRDPFDAVFGDVAAGPFRPTEFLRPRRGR